MFRKYIRLNGYEVYDPVLDTWVAQADPSGWTTSGSNYVFTAGTASLSWELLR